MNNVTIWFIKSPQNTLITSKNTKNNLLCFIFKLSVKMVSEQFNVNIQVTFFAFQLIFGFSSTFHNNRFVSKHTPM